MEYFSVSGSSHKGLADLRLNLPVRTNIKAIAIQKQLFESIEGLEIKGPGSQREVKIH